GKLARTSRSLLYREPVLRPSAWLPPFARPSVGFGRWAGRGVLLVCLLSSGRARAQSNYDAAVLGGRAAMMGGASTARGSDGAVLFTNPAGITRIPGESFSFGTVAAAFSQRFVN